MSQPESSFSFALLRFSYVCLWSFSLSLSLSFVVTIIGPIIFFLPQIFFSCDRVSGVVATHATIVRTHGLINEEKKRKCLRRISVKEKMNLRRKKGKTKKKKGTRRRRQYRLWTRTRRQTRLWPLVSVTMSHKVSVCSAAYDDKID